MDKPRGSAGGREPRCRDRAYFRNDPAHLEHAFKGLASFSSVYGSVRAEDGLCLRHDLYLGAGRRCAGFAAAVPRHA